MGNCPLPPGPREAPIRHAFRCNLSLQHIILEKVAAPRRAAGIFMANTKSTTDKTERKKIKRAARKKAAPKAKRTAARGSNKKKIRKLARGQSKR